MTCGIYKITNIKNGKIYIGQSINIERRWKRHLSASKNPKRNEYNAPLHIDMREFGDEAFKIEILEECDSVKLNEREKYWIEKTGAFQFGYNNSFNAGCNKLRKTYFFICNDLENTNLTGREIAKKYGVSEQMVSAINTGLRWKHSRKYPIREQQPAMIQTCSICGKMISKNSKSGLCFKCYKANDKNRKINITKEGLIKLLLQKTFKEIGELFNVTDTAVRKKCKKIGLPYTVKDLKKWRNNYK